MSVTYDTGTKTARMEAVATRIGGAGKLEIGTAGMAAVLVTYTLGSPPGTVTADVLTLTTLPATEAATGTGTAAQARIRTSANADRVTGLTVGLADADVILDSLSITTGQNVTLNSATIQHAPDP